MTSAALQVGLTVSKPGEKGDVPVGVIAGSVIAGLVLLALVVGLLWKVRTHTLINSLVSPKYVIEESRAERILLLQFGFFKRKYQQLQKEADDDQPSRPHVDEVL